MLLGLGKTLTFGQKMVWPYATGGDRVYLYQEGNKTYRVHEFLSTGTSTLEVEVGGQMDVFIVAGGGGGSGHRFGNPGGGGGAGGKILNTNVNVAAGSYSVTVGAGGLGSAGNSNTYGEDGATSAFSDWEATGGGAGGYATSVGRNGGSGGGGSSRSSGGSGIVGQGYDGGDGYYVNSSGVDTAGGGGGASEAGHDGFVGDVKDGTGGAGVEWPSGSGNVYAEGGDGGRRNEFDDGDDALPNTGSGGGGGDGSGGGTRNGGDGGSGIVIVRYVVAEKTLWTPSELGSSVAAWYDADEISGLSNEDPLTTWTDKSVNSRDVISSSTNRPTYKTNILNGKSVLEFDGTNDYLEKDSSFVVNLQESTIVWIARVSSTAINRVMISETSTSNNTPVLQAVRTSATFGTYTWTFRNDSNVLNSYTTSPVSVNTWAINLHEDTLSALKYAQNGASYSQAGTYTRSTTTVNRFTIGRDSRFGGENYFHGQIAELIFVDGLLSTEEKQKLEGYLAHKWGLTNNLPSGHPYKYEPPYKVEPEEIVTDGLVLNLDAGDYASYPRNGTTWYDISGNGLTGALTNGPTYDSANKGSIVFDGSDDYVDVSDVPFRISGVEFTMDIWFYFDGNNTSEVLCGKRNDSSPYNQYSLWINDGTNTITGSGNILRTFLRIDESTSHDRGVNYTLSSSGIYNAVVTNDSGSLKLYVNNSLAGNSSNTYPSPANLLISGQNFRIADLYVGGYRFSNKVYGVKFYNRALSSTEISQNFNALRGRYGI